MLNRMPCRAAAPASPDRDTAHHRDLLRNARREPGTPTSGTLAQSICDQPSGFAKAGTTYGGAFAGRGHDSADEPAGPGGTGTASFRRGPRLNSSRSGPAIARGGAAIIQMVPTSSCRTRRENHSRHRRPRRSRAAGRCLPWPRRAASGIQASGSSRPRRDH